MDSTSEKVVIVNDSQSTEEEEETFITCRGCREGIFNQLGHMESGGCLYDPDY
jgi:hypothetical protein